jgi:hypothetical protein
MLCARCHTINPNGSLHCATCGDRLAVSAVPGGAAPGSVTAPPPRRTSTMAVAGFVLGFLWLLAILGLVFSIAGYMETKRSRGVVGGAGLAVAGIVISSVMILISLSAL